MRALTYGLVALAFTVSGCAGSGSDERAAELDTVEVTAAPDADASLADEPVARPIGMPPAGVAGAVPGDFPREVPLPSPSSLVDFTAGGREKSVTLVVDLPAAQVSAVYRRQLESAGFVAGEGGAFVAHGLVVRYAVEPFHDATRLTVRVVLP